MSASLLTFFYRIEPCRRALGQLRGLLSTVVRRNGWQLAEQMGERCPDGVQRVLNAAHWDEPSATAGGAICHGCSQNMAR